MAAAEKIPTNDDNTDVLQLNFMQMWTFFAFCRRLLLMCMCAFRNASYFFPLFLQHSWKLQQWNKVKFRVTQIMQKSLLSISMYTQFIDVILVEHKKMDFSFTEKTFVSNGCY